MALRVRALHRSRSGERGPSGGAAGAGTVASACVTGCRISEALGLIWDDVNLARDEGQIRAQLLPKGSRGPLKTKNSERTLKLPLEAVHALKHQRTKARGFVWHSRTGRPLQRRNVSKAFDWAQIGLKDTDRLNLHGLRRTAATLMLMRASRYTRSPGTWATAPKFSSPRTATCSAGGRSTWHRPCRLF